MRQIHWVLLIGPPCLAVLGWLMTRGWISAVSQGRSTPLIALWKKYDFWIILGVRYVVIRSAAIIDHKL
jgi:hypothetical protein